MARAPQVPGAPADTELPAAVEADEADPRDIELARLRALLAAQSTPSAVATMEGGGARTAQYKAESKHRHLTAAELSAMVRSGEVKLTDHHVLCSDGWYVNPAAQAQSNG